MESLGVCLLHRLLRFPLVGHGKVLQSLLSFRRKVGDPGLVGLGEPVPGAVLDCRVDGLPLRVLILVKKLD